MAEVRRLYAPRLPAQGGEVTLDDAAAHHARVLRLSPGDPVRLFDGRGVESEGRVTRLDDGSVVCDVGAPRDVTPDGPRIVLVQAMAKGDKLDAIVRMSTELGVGAIHLADTERTVSRPDARRAAKRVERLSRVAREAARQAGRADVPELVPPSALVDVVARAPADATRLVFWERGREPLASALASEGSEGEAQPPGEGREVWLCIGPEGGLSVGEAEALESAGWLAVGLGRTVLRVETAAPVAVALVLDRLGQLRPDSASSR